MPVKTKSQYFLDLFQKKIWRSKKFSIFDGPKYKIFPLKHTIIYSLNTLWYFVRNVYVTQVLFQVLIRVYGTGAFEVECPWWHPYPTHCTATIPLHSSYHVQYKLATVWNIVFISRRAFKAFIRISSVKTALSLSYFETHNLHSSSTYDDLPLFYGTNQIQVSL